jgi:hypothetical protein
MAILTTAPPGAKCVFSSCKHAPAKETYIHEFANYSQKHLCPKHIEIVLRIFPKTVGRLR